MAGEGEAPGTEREMEGATPTLETEVYEADDGRECCYQLQMSAAVCGGDPMRGPSISCRAELHTYEVCELCDDTLKYQLFRFDPYDMYSPENVDSAAARMSMAEAVVSMMAEKIEEQGLPPPDWGSLLRCIRRYVMNAAASRIARSRRRRSGQPLSVEVCAAMHVKVRVPDTMGNHEVLQLPSPSTAMDEETTSVDDQLSEADDAEFYGSDGDGDGDNCAICLEKVRRDGRCCLPCSHAFHGECIGRWLQQKDHCPLCRAEICQSADSIQ